MITIYIYDRKHDVIACERCGKPCVPCRILHNQEWRSSQLQCPACTYKLIKKYGLVPYEKKELTKGEFEDE